MERGESEHTRPSDIVMSEVRSTKHTHEDQTEWEGPSQYWIREKAPPPQHTQAYCLKEGFISPQISKIQRNKNKLV